MAGNQSDSIGEIKKGMESAFEKLFELGRIGTLDLKKKSVMALMGEGALMKPDGRMSQRGID